MPLQSGHPVILGFRSDDGAAYFGDDLRDDGISEGFKAVHPVGYPMSHSTQSGFSRPFATAFKFTAVAKFIPCFPAFCEGVGFV